MIFIISNNYCFCQSELISTSCLYMLNSSVLILFSFYSLAPKQ